MLFPFSLLHSTQLHFLSFKPIRDEKSVRSIFKRRETEGPLSKGKRKEGKEEEEEKGPRQIGFMLIRVRRLGREAQAV